MNDTDTKPLGDEFSNAKLIGPVKIFRSSGRVEDDNGTRYEIYNLGGNELRSLGNWPRFNCYTKILSKNHPPETDNDHYFIWKNNLYYSKEKKLLENNFFNKQNAINNTDSEEGNIREGYFTTSQNTTNNAGQEIDQMSGPEFEKLVSSLFQKMGFDVTLTKQTADGGIDLIVHNNQPFLEGIYIVQCKRWGSNIGEPAVRDLYGVVTAERANKGILITNSNYTNSAINFAQGKQIELIDGIKLLNLLEKHELLPKDHISDEAVCLSSGMDEDTDLKEILSTLSNIVRKDPSNTSLRIKLAYKQINSVWYGSLSRNFKLKMIRDAEDNLNYLLNINDRSKGKACHFIRHLSYHQLGYLKMVQGQVAEGIQYYLKAKEITSFSKRSIQDPGYGVNGNYNWNLNDFFIQNLLNIITLSNYLGANRLAQKFISKYGHRIDKYIRNLRESSYTKDNPYDTYLKKEWMNRTLYILNYHEDTFELEEIVEEIDGNPDNDNYNYDGLFPSDLEQVFDFLNTYSGLCSISDEAKNNQKKTVDAIT